MMQLSLIRAVSLSLAGFQWTLSRLKRSFAPNAIVAMSKSYSVVIQGGGPVGLACAASCVMAVFYLRLQALGNKGVRPPRSFLG